MIKGLIYSVLLALFCTAASAQDLSTKRPLRQSPKKTNPRPAPKDVTAFVFNLGTHTEYFNHVQNDSSGGIRKIDLKTPTIGFGLVMPVLEQKFNFLPELNWVLPRKAGSSRIIKNLFMLRGDLGYDALSWLRLRAGTSLMWLNQHGRGGKATMNNGNSTSTFYYPEENRSSLNNTLDLGVEALMDEWSLRIQTYTYSIFVSEKRQVSYTLFVSYYWDR